MGSTTPTTKLVAVEDSERTKIVYNPSDNWKQNENCVACNITSPPARAQLLSTASDSTWTNAWWATGIPKITATFEFQGTSVAVYFILFDRSLDKAGSVGPSNLNFYIDSKLDTQKQINAADYVFTNDMTQRTLMFQASNLDPVAKHTFIIEWDNGGTLRPEVALALDTIEYTPSPGGPTLSPDPLRSTSLPPTLSPTLSSTTTPATTSTNLPASSSSSQSVIIAVPIATSLLALLVLVLGIFWWRRRKQHRREREEEEKLKGIHPFTMPAVMPPRSQFPVESRPELASSFYGSSPHEYNPYEDGMNVGGPLGGAGTATTPPPYAQWDDRTASTGSGSGSGVFSMRRTYTPVTKSSGITSTR